MLNKDDVEYKPDFQSKQFRIQLFIKRNIQVTFIFFSY